MKRILILVFSVLMIVLTHAETLLSFEETGQMHDIYIDPFTDEKIETAIYLNCIDMEDQGLGSISIRKTGEIVEVLISASPLSYNPPMLKLSEENNILVYRFDKDETITIEVEYSDNGCIIFVPDDHIEGFVDSLFVRERLTIRLWLEGNKPTIIIFNNLTYFRKHLENIGISQKN